MSLWRDSFLVFFLFFPFKMLGILTVLDQKVRDKRKLVKVGNFHLDKIFPQKKTHRSKVSHRLSVKRNYLKLVLF